VIEIARALVSRPRILVMDEPTSSLTQADAERLFALIGRLRGQGVAIIYVSHFLEECRRVADRFTVLRDGQTVGSGPIAATSIDALVALMTGRPAENAYPSRSRSMGPVVLGVRSARSAPRLRGASLELRGGEVLGVAGLVGAGRTDLLRTLFGLDELDSGEVAVVGGDTRRATPRHRWSQGIGFLSENRKEEGLMLNLSVQDNVTLTKLDKLGRLGWVNAAAQAKAARRWAGELAIKCRTTAQPVGELSGGNQQKVALARLLEHPARILLLDEPTRGIDVGSKAQVYAIIAGLAAAGKAVLLTSSYLPELLGMCDTIAVMRRGELVAVRPRAAWTEAELLRQAVGGE
jgi:ribose transport system ATP-binding protein